jgi:hypothetical protein
MAKSTNPTDSVDGTSQADFLKIIADSGKSALTATMVISGGAAATFLTFLGNVLPKETLCFREPDVTDFGWATVFFFAGAYLSVSASGTAYMANFVRFQMQRPRWGDIGTIWTIANAMLALVCSAIGLGYAAWPFLHRGGTIVARCVG